MGCEKIQKQILEPAIKGTVNVLKAAKEAGVERVVATSSISSIMPSPNWPADKIKGVCEDFISIFYFNNFLSVSK